MKKEKGEGEEEEEGGRQGRRRRKEGGGGGGWVPQMSHFYKVFLRNLSRLEKQVKPEEVGKRSLIPHDWITIPSPARRGRERGRKQRENST